MLPDWTAFMDGLFLVQIKPDAMRQIRRTAWPLCPADAFLGATLTVEPLLQTIPGEARSLAT
jgi:hypothetical protein